MVALAHSLGANWRIHVGLSVGRSPVGEPLVQLNGGRFGSADCRGEAATEVRTAETQKACRWRRTRWKDHQTDPRRRNGASESNIKKMSTKWLWLVKNEHCLRICNTHPDFTRNGCFLALTSGHELSELGDHKNTFPASICVFKSGSKSRDFVTY